MSDDEYYENSSDSDDSDDLDEEIITKMPLKTINSDNDDDDDIISDDDSEIDDDNDDVSDYKVKKHNQVGGDSDDSDEESNTDEETQQIKNYKQNNNNNYVDEGDDEDEDEDDTYLQKFSDNIIKNYVNDFHPECFNHNYEEINKLAIVVRDSNNIIIDPLHKTIPYLTKYEKARILGQRAKQIETGSTPFINISENIIDSAIIAELELKEKKIPFIIKRPIPNGGCEYWKLNDLEIIN